MNDAIQFADYLAIAVFAISGALAAAERRLDIFGFVLFGTITGVGGGTVRDLLLDETSVFWIADTHYLWVGIGASVATWFFAPLIKSLEQVLVWADGLGMALFSVLGAVKAQQAGVAPVVCIVMGLMTATFGSILRDTLLNRDPVLLGPEIYATAAILGATSFVVLDAFGVPELLAMLIAMGCAFALRACAILFDLRLPKYRR
ncbi:MAG: trimeric intracellular cation channel family protein [Pseudomonadota bacterium]